MKLQTIKAKAQKGFTLIELMITVAIVGILAAVALPAYQDYTIRAQVAEGMALASGAKSAVAEYHANKGSFPTTNTEAGFSGAVGKYVSAVAVGTGGIIEASFGGDANTNLSGKKLTLTPTEDTTTGNVKWACSSDAAAKYLPQSCGAAAAPGGGGGESGGEGGE